MGPAFAGLGDPLCGVVVAAFVYVIADSCDRFCVDREPRAAMRTDDVDPDRRHHRHGSIATMPQNAIEIVDRIAAQNATCKRLYR